MLRVNVGCGKDVLEGWVNIDQEELSGVDVIADLDQCADTPLPLEDDSADEFLLSHIIEHLEHPLPLMQELHRIAKSGARAIIRVPHGASDDAYEDPTHVQQYFHGSFGYFSQPFYWRADYGYRGDWKAEKIELIVPREGNEGVPPEQIMKRIKTLRNQVLEMVVELSAVKPARPASKDLQTNSVIQIVLSP